MNALSDLSRKKSRKVTSQLSLPGRFLSRCWCITVEVEPGIVKLYKCHYCCSCKKYRGKVVKDGRKRQYIVFRHRFSRVRGKNAVWDIL